MTSICRTAYNLLTTLSLSFLLLVAAPGLQAQGNANPSATAWPVKPVRIVVPFSPGGNTDAIARISAERLGAALGQQFIVENRVGAAGMIATEFVARAAADGYTLIMATGSQVITAPFTQKISFDPVAELAPIAVIGANALVITVPQSLPVNNLREFVEYAKARPGQLNYGSGGIGTTPFLATELFKSLAGIDVVHVPYKGGAPALADLVAGQLSFMIENVPGTLPFVKDGKLRALAITSRQRLPLVPEVPTMIEAGVADYEMIGWNGIFLPKGTPAEITTRLNADLVKVLGTGEMKEQLGKLGAEPVGSTPAAFAAFVQAESRRWGKIIKDLGIKPE